MLVTIFIVDIVNSISVHSRTPQEPEDKIVSTYKKKPKQAWIGCVMGQRLQCIITSEMVLV